MSGLDDGVARAFRERNRCDQRTKEMVDALVERIGPGPSVREPISDMCEVLDAVLALQGVVAMVVPKDKDMSTLIGERVIDITTQACSRSIELAFAACSSGREMSSAEGEKLRGTLEAIWRARMDGLLRAAIGPNGGIIL